MKQEWVAILPSILKSSKAFSADLPDSEKLPVPKGARLSAVLTSEDRDYWVIAHGFLDGVAIPERLRFVYKGQWKLEPAPGAPAPATPEVLSVPRLAQATIVQRSRRRRFAAFRRRLSQV